MYYRSCNTTGPFPSWVPACASLPASRPGLCHFLLPRAAAGPQLGPRPGSSAAWPGSRGPPSAGPSSACPRPRVESAHVRAVPTRAELVRVTACPSHGVSSHGVSESQRAMCTHPRARRTAPYPAARSLGPTRPRAAVGGAAGSGRSRPRRGRRAYGLRGEGRAGWGRAGAAVPPGRYRVPSCASRRRCRRGRRGRHSRRNRRNRRSLRGGGAREGPGGLSTPTRLSGSLSVSLRGGQSNRTHMSRRKAPPPALHWQSSPARAPPPPPNRRPPPSPPSSPGRSPPPKAGRHRLPRSATTSDSESTDVDAAAAARIAAGKSSTRPFRPLNPAAGGDAPGAAAASGGVVARRLQPRGHGAAGP